MRLIMWKIRYLNPNFCKELLLYRLLQYKEPHESVHFQRKTHFCWIPLKNVNERPPTGLQKYKGKT